MHYTSIENIHKVIDPLFLDDLKNEFAEILTIGVQKQKKKKLEEFLALPEILFRPSLWLWQLLDRNLYFAPPSGK